MASASSRWAWLEQSKLQESTEQIPGGHRGEEGRRSTYSTPRRYHRGMARQCPRGHDGIKPGEVADDISVYRLARQAPDLAEDKAKQLEIKLEVDMAKIQSVGATETRAQKGAIDKISRIDRSAVA
jgi:hypothetical protein